MNLKRSGYKMEMLTTEKRVAEIKFLTLVKLDDTREDNHNIPSFSMWESRPECTGYYRPLSSIWSLGRNLGGEGTGGVGAGTDRPNA